jgi:excisionase family DNA binding protein
MSAPALTAPASPLDRPWSFADLARHIGVSDRHLRRLAKKGRVRTIRIGDRVLVPALEVARLLNEGC